ncbi:MAG: tetratricopeptide repeat protein [Promethearchaeota archaeon]
MLDSKPSELIRVEELICEAKFDETLEMIEEFELKSHPTQKERLSVLIIKGRIYNYKYKWNKAVDIGEQVYKESQEIGDTTLIIDALLLKSNPQNPYINLDNSLKYVLEAEKKNKKIDKSLSSDYMRRKASILLCKAKIYLPTGLYKKALRHALQSLEIWEKLNRKIDVAYTFQVIGYIYEGMGDRDAGLDYTMKSLSIQEELNNRVGIAASLTNVEWLYNVRGYFNQAIEVGTKILDMKETSNFHKINVLLDLGTIYKIKGELDQALRYTSKSLKLAEKENNNISIAFDLLMIGDIYEMKGNDIKAIENYQRSLKLFEEMNLWGSICVSLNYLVNIYIEKNSRKQAQQYLERLKNLAKKIVTKRPTHMYLNAKAYFLKTSGRTRDRAKAETIWRQVVNDKISFPAQYIEALSRLCEFLIEELEMSNDLEILNELNPLIRRWHNIAEKTQSHLWLAETKLLQAKVALINMEIEEGKKLMTEAQRLAEMHGLTKLAQRISYEHDTLLEQINKWETLKNTDAPISKRVQLASIKGTINQLEGRAALEEIESEDEQPTVLLILGEGGSLVFSYPFSNEWKIDEDLFSSFLSAFTSFSTEFFSKGLDRAKFGDDMMLMESIGSFSFCYLFRGQTYLAKQKLTKFKEKVQDDNSLWQSLEQHYKNGQILELNESPQLESLITETFLAKS